MDSVIEVQGVSVKLGGSTVIRRVSLKLCRGEILAILGPNGAGKTTLLRTMLGLLKPFEGQVLVNGRDVRLYKPRELARVIAYVPQENTVPFPYTAAEVVLMGKAPHLGLLGTPRKHDYEEALRIMKLLGVDHLAYRPFNTLSGGEKRLVLIARALAQKPQALLLDEPTSGLDLGNKLRILNLIQELSHRSIAIAFTTHDPNEALAIASRIVVLNRGTVVFSGNPAGLGRETLERIYGVTMKQVEVDGRRWVLAISWESLRSCCA